MSGHSKWSTIKRQKGVADIKRGQIFTKLANVITLAAKMGSSGDPDANPRLRMEIEAARAVNMPKENIQRAIDRGLGKGEGVNLEEVLYEGFGPFGTAFIVEGVTDNKMRTLQGVKNTFERNGGHLAGSGAVSYMFERCGEIRIKGKAAEGPLRSGAGEPRQGRGGSADDEMLNLIDLGAKDVDAFLEDNIQNYLVYTESSELNTMGNKITQSGFSIESQGLIYKPKALVKITDIESANKVMDFAEKLEDLDDVQKVYANFDLPEELVN